jgi:hypothetical protein
MDLQPEHLDAMRDYLVFGSRLRSTDDLRESIARALGVDLVAHESGYMGGAYFRAGPLDDEHVVLRSNVDASRPELEPAYPDFCDYPTILEINATDRSDDLRERLRVVAELEHLQTTRM